MALAASLWDDFNTSNFCDLCLATTTTTLTRDRTDDDTDNRQCLPPPRTLVCDNEAEAEIFVFGTA